MTFHRTLFLSSAILVAAGISASAAEVVYREVFPTSNPSGNILVTTATWNAHSGATAASQNGNGGLGISNGFGRPADLAGLNAGIQASTNTDRGYYANFDANLLNIPFLYWTQEFSIATSEVESFQWHLGNNASTDVFRLAIQITPTGSDVGTWFASSTTFSSSVAIDGGTFKDKAELKTLVFASATFNTLAFTPGSALALGGSAALPDGMITAFGLYTDKKSNTQRFDTFTINAVPEPSVALLCVTGIAFLGTRRRRS